MKTKIEVLKTKHHDVTIRYETVKTIVKKITKVADETTFETEHNEVNRRFEDVQNKLKDKQDQVNKLSYKLNKFSETVLPLEDDILRFEAFLDSLKPFGMVVEEGKADMVKIAEFVAEVQKTSGKVEEAKNNGRDLIELLQHFDADSWPVQNHVTEVCRKYDAVVKRIDFKREEVTRQVRVINHFNDELKEGEKWLVEFFNKVAKLEPVSSEPEVIKQQLADVESLLDDIDGRKPKLQYVDEVSDEVIQNNPDDYSVHSETKFRVNKLREPIDRVSLKLFERRTKLQGLLVCSQELQDTVDDFSDRLTTIERTMSKLQKVSARHEIAQKQDVFTQELLNQVVQLEPSFQVLEKTAQKVLKETEPKEREVLQAKIGELRRRWMNSHDKLQTRKQVTEQVIPKAADFEEKEREFSDWMTETENQLEPETEDIDEAKIEREVDRLKVSWDEYNDYLIGW